MLFKKTMTALMGTTLALGLAASAASVQAADYEIKIVYLGSMDDEDYDGSMVFKDYVESTSNGAVAVTIFPGGQLCGNTNECLEAMQGGVIEVHQTTVGGFGSIYPEIMALDLPYMFDSDRVAEIALSGPFEEFLRREILKRTNLRLMTITQTGGWRNIVNTKHEVRTPADVKGLKLRTIPSELQQELVRLLGGSPTAVPWPEVYTSLATGVVDGSKNGITDIVNMKFHEHVKYMTLDGHAYMTAFWWMNNDMFMSMPFDLRKIVNDGFEHLRNVTTAFPKRRQIEAYETFKKAGGKIYVPTPEEKAQFVEAAKPLRQWYIDKFGDKLLVELEKGVQAARDQLAAEYETLK